MSDNAYSSHRDGKYVSVPPIDDLCLALKDKFLRQEETIERLEGEIKKLKSDNYKDDELAKMKARYESMIDDYYRGFPISEREMNKIDEWKKTHDCHCRGMKIGSAYTYIFQPTEVGVFGTIKCSCGKTFTFQEP